ncbi:DUF1656 domain-containing protein [Thioclava sp. BHET1]|nr:DUF1656 domain-containing protein [Thioclava sp. BHET1]
MQEIDIYGIFVPALVVFGLIGALLAALLRRLLLWLGAYRFVWHQALFDLALLILCIGIVFAVMTGHFDWSLPSLPLS